MKKLILPVILSFCLIFSACLSLPEGGGFSLNEAMGDAVSSSMGMDNLAVELQALQFYGLYLSYAFYGGYNYETGFDEGEGLKWSFRSESDDGSVKSSVYERVFLKDMGDGSGWWRLSAESEDETAEYEYLMDEEAEFLAIRFRDSETGEIIEYIPETGEEESTDEQMIQEEPESEISEEEYEAYSEYEYNQYSMGNEKITVGAGTYTAEHMVSEMKDDSDPSNPVDLRSDWWVVESVPGEVIKYLWVDNTDDNTLESELLDILSGQKTRLESY